MDVHLLDGKIVVNESVFMTACADDETVTLFLETIEKVIDENLIKKLKVIMSDGENCGKNIDEKNNLNAVTLLRQVANLHKKNAESIDLVLMTEQLQDMDDINRMCSQGRCVRLLCILNAAFSYFNASFPQNCVSDNRY